MMFRTGNGQKALLKALLLREHEDNDVGIADFSIHFQRL